MKTKYIFSGIFLFLFTLSFSQRVGFNDRLFVQLTKNQAVRVLSANNFTDQFEKQNDFYRNINDKANRIVVIHEYIHDKLTKVHTNIRHGKRIWYTLQYIDDITNNCGILMNEAAANPVIATTLGDYYAYILQETMAIQQEIQQVILKEDDTFLMDIRDRDKLIDNVYHRVKNINNSLQYMVLLIESRKHTKLWNNLPFIGNYIQYDTQIVNDIMSRWNSFNF